MKFADSNPSVSTEDLILSIKEQEILKRFKFKLQSKYNVKILMPDVDHNSSSTDLIFATLTGKKRNIEKVKGFLSERIKMNEKKKSASDVPVITLCDSDDEELPRDDSVYIIDSIMETERVNVPTSNSLEDSVCIIESSFTQENTSSLNKKSKFSDRKTDFPSSDAGNSEICEVTSTTDEPALKKAKLDEDKQKQPRPSPAPDFLPLFIPFKSKQKCNAVIKKESPGPSGSSATASNDDIIVLDESTVKKSAQPRKLRPIVIDGSNIARLHGTKTKTFSAQGIKICVDYFMNRGHTEVICFVPLFRRHADRWKTVPTTNTEILEDLAEKQIVVFTPSRKVNGRRISSYDDRFVVELASQNGGVIVSNDCFSDLIEENESFKEAIEKRLLQFLFVNDTFMVPNDPLGRNGPTLDEFLSFPPEDSAKT